MHRGRVAGRPLGKKRPPLGPGRSGQRRETSLEAGFRNTRNQETSTWGIRGGGSSVGTTPEIATVVTVATPVVARAESFHFNCLPRVTSADLASLLGRAKTSAHFSHHSIYVRFRSNSRGPCTWSILRRFSALRVNVFCMRSERGIPGAQIGGS